MQQLTLAPKDTITQHLTHPASFKVTLRDFALVTHCVPAARVRACLPKQLELQTFRDEQTGESFAFVSVGVFFNKNFRWSHGPERLSLNFYQATYRTYINHHGRNAAYFFKTYLETVPSYLLQRSAAHCARKAEFEVNAASDLHGYKNYSCVFKGREGVTQLELEARELPRARPPFRSGEELSQFLTYRLHGIFRSSIGIHTDQMVQHRRIYPWSGRLKSGRFDYWKKLGILSSEEALNPYSVLIEPSVEFTFFPPLPVRWLYA